MRSTVVSRAFVKTADVPEVLADRMISAHPNFVTEFGVDRTPIHGRRGGTRGGASRRRPIGARSSDQRIALLDFAARVSATRAQTRNY
jgi:hypothetical protein